MWLRWKCTYVMERSPNARMYAWMVALSARRCWYAFSSLKLLLLLLLLLLLPPTRGRGGLASEKTESGLSSLLGQGLLLPLLEYDAVTLLARRRSPR